jgi:hypothetical protein
LYPNASHGDHHLGRIAPVLLVIRSIGQGEGRVEEIDCCRWISFDHAVSRCDRWRRHDQSVGHLNRLC